MAASRGRLALPVCTGSRKTRTKTVAIAGQAVDAGQEGHALCGTPHQVHEHRDQTQVATCADHPASHSATDGHRHGHPEPPDDCLDVQLVGLDVTQLDLPAQDVMLMELLARSARSVRQAAMVRSSSPKAATIACSGQPWQSKVSTMSTNSVGFLRR